MAKSETGFEDSTGDSVGRKRRFTARIAYDVVAPLEALVRQHPELGFDSTAGAITHAVVHYTEELREKIARTQTNDPDAPVPSEAEVLRLFQRFLQHRAPPAPSKRGREPQA